MAASVKGIPQLQARFRALEDVPARVTKQWQLRTVREAKLTVRKATRNTSRTIRPYGLTPREVAVVAGGAAVFLEGGTRAHTIVPRRKKWLMFATDPKDRTLSGRPKKGAKSIRFAKRVRHPGTKPYPFLKPAAQKALEDIGAEVVIEPWNRAA